MNATARLIALLAFTSFLGSITLADDAKAIRLFDGKSLDGWVGHDVGPDATTEDIWSVADGILVCQGNPMGYLHTKEKFTNFKLRVDWRWPEGSEGGNSGVLMRMTGEPPSILTRCVEAQLQSGSAGDIWGFYGFQLKGDAARAKKVENHKVLGNFIGVSAIKHPEKTIGQWNTYEITFNQGKLTIVINGELANEATDCEVVPGFVGLQSEGAEIHFRNVELTKLPD
ncbi:3-keto-disaccharide hydrolase [Novipirellula artificiosorum]|uniref:3-keto-alpha-glucoside-1,2-lyase/3-keto-2-hydroxy-glucal hydratase domain-containing protein n=1 Tax=Novipirellula artificiosorum TaxID=2528016 RepID=A0A5C6E4B7_9BACT|nr:DUF1080 domain-containing protein [Novipirellula artificiosorum]TWU42431.1 hypothetical protein Poly41_07280 [Novipirellula artificiosorum]